MSEEIEENFATIDRNMADMAGAHAALRHLLVRQMAESFLRKPKRALRDAEAFFESPESRPAFAPVGGAPGDRQVAVAAGIEAEHARVRDAVRARIAERVGW